jgi:hypothetical protein
LVALATKYLDRYRRLTGTALVSPPPPIAGFHDERLVVTSTRQRMSPTPGRS